MSVSVDGVKVISAYVSSRGWTAYSVNAPLAAGSHEVSVTFDNDYYRRCDRNLRVDELTFSE